jgi:hypothetical protein
MGARTHLALAKDAPITRPIMPASAGRVVSTPQVGGLHHRYDRGRRNRPSMSCLPHLRGTALSALSPWWTRRYREGAAHVRTIERRYRLRPY